MKAQTVLGFMLIGIVIALLPIFLGDLRTWEQALVAVVVSAIVSGAGIMAYNFKKSHAAEKSGDFSTPTVPFLPRVVYTVAASVITVIVASLT